MSQRFRESLHDFSQFRSVSRKLWRLMRDLHS